MFKSKGITRCENGCSDNSWLTFAHRHKRRWYLNKGELINDYNQILLLCIHCHQKIEKDSILTEETFDRLRGKENDTK